MADRLRIDVPTEDGRLCAFDFVREDGFDNGPGYWVVKISDTLIRQAPQAIHAALGQAVMQMKELV